MQLIGIKDSDDTKVEETLKKLSEIDTNCDQILVSLKELFSVLRVHCPRYYFFKDDQMMMLCSLLKFPKVHWYLQVIVRIHGELVFWALLGGAARNH